jgi:hypothetical protein
MSRKSFTSFCTSGEGGLNASFLLIILGTAAVSLKKSFDTAVAVRGWGGHTNGYRDVTGAVIKVDGNVRKILMLSDTSCQPQGGLCGADGRDGRSAEHDCIIGTADLAADIGSGPKVVEDDTEVGSGDGLGCGDVGLVGSVAGAGGRAGVGSVEDTDMGDGVNGGTPNAGKSL